MKKIIMLLAIIGLIFAVPTGFYYRTPSGVTIAYPDDSEKESRKQAQEEYEREKKETEAKLAAYRPELKTSKDPVEVALRMVAEEERFWQCILCGMQTLAQHWDDARAESALKQIAENNKRDATDEEISLSSSTKGSTAYGYWQYIFAKRTQKLLNSKEKPDKKKEAIREYFKTYQYLEGTAVLPESLFTGILNFDLIPLRKEFSDLLKLFIKTAVDLEGGQAMDLVIETKALDKDERKEYVTKYVDGAIAYARQVGPERTFDNFSFLLVETKSDKVAVLFEEWLKGADFWDKSLERIALMVNTRPRLVNIMQTDPRLNVVQWIADKITSKDNNYGFKPDRASFKAAKEAIERLKKAGAKDEELAPLKELLKNHEDEFNKDEKQKKSGGS